MRNVLATRNPGGGDACTHHRICLVLWTVPDVRGAENRAVGQQLHARIAGIPGSFAHMFENVNAAIAGLARSEIVVCADPGDILPLRGRPLCLIAKRNEEPSIRQIDAFIQNGASLTSRISSSNSAAASNYPT